MHRVMLYIVLFIGTIVVLADVKGCSDCWSNGGTPVKGVVTHACVQTK